MTNINNFSEIEKFILEKISENSNNVTQLTAQKFNITVQAINRYLKKLEDKEIIKSEGNTKAKKYYLQEQKFKYTLNITPYSDENEIWKEYIKPHLTNISENVYKICNHGSTKILNNVIDHSQSKNITIGLSINPVNISILIRDSGIGIFEKIKTECNFKDHLEALQELVKGKLTTDSIKHSGEGIFFTSKMFDEFMVTSNKLRYLHKSENVDCVIENQNLFTGTIILMSIKQNSIRNPQDVFKEYTTGDFAFDKTIIPVELTQYGEDDLVSRAQAKRILARLEKFKEIILDFKNVNSIGQAFADEIFRVFTNAHPHVRFIPINTNEEIDFMIKRVSA